MKLFIVTVLSLVSSVAMADGFRCQGNDFRVKMYNETQPERGTRNPAVLVVYERGIGTVAVVDGSDIEKTNGEDTVTYEGQVNGKLDGRFTYVKLSIEKQARQDGAFAGLHVAKLQLNADKERRVQTLACSRYVKHEE